MEQEETSINQITEKFDKLSTEYSRLQTSVSSIRSDIEKIKTSLAEKIPKAILSELEGKINTHTKALDSTSKKLFELQNNLNTFIQQPISHTLVDTMKQQITTEIVDQIKILLADQDETVKQLIDTKIAETKSSIQNMKRFMYR
jgi:chromosome segregation ATPase